jgi:hypothetical protein
VHEGQQATEMLAGMFYIVTGGLKKRMTETLAGIFILKWADVDSRRKYVNSGYQ